MIRFYDTDVKGNTIGEKTGQGLKETEAGGRVGHRTISWCEETVQYLDGGGGPGMVGLLELAE